MSESTSNTITIVTRRVIFKAIRDKDFPWWGESSELDLLGQVFDLESMDSYDSRHPNAASDITFHRDAYRDWEDYWLFEDERFDLLNCEDSVLLHLFEVMVHPATQPNRNHNIWLVSLLNQNLASDGWKLEQVSILSGRPVYKAGRREPIGRTMAPQYVAPVDLKIDLESLLYSVSRVFAHRGKTTEVAILAEAIVEITEDSYDNWDGGTYGYSLSLGIPPALYAQISDGRSEYANEIREELSNHFPHKHNLHEVLIRPFQKAPEGWQEKAKAWVDGNGVTNQGRVRSTNIAGREHDGLLFRSQPEINLYEALKQKGVAFAPLPVFLRGGANYRRLEPDFIILKDGIFAVVEVDGDSFHPETPAAARTRLKLLEDAGAYIIRVNASHCISKELADDCAEGIIGDITTHKNNRR